VLRQKKYQLRTSYLGFEVLYGDYVCDYSAPWFQLHALSSRKKGRVVRGLRASKEVLHKLQFFVEVLHGEVYGAEFVEQSQTPSKDLTS